LFEDFGEIPARASKPPSTQMGESHEPFDSAKIFFYLRACTKITSHFGAAPRWAAARKAAGFVARSLHTTAGMRVARASPSTLRASSKMGSYFYAGP